VDDSPIEMDPSGFGTSEDCAESLKELYSFLDGELTTERRTHIQVHLDGCLQCYEAFDFEAELRIVISTRCKEEVPEDLRGRVADALRRLGDGSEPV
jgi:anti-sigma factor (TIGR02949 family)